MLRTLELLKDEIFKSHEVIDFKGGENFYFLKIEAEIVDGSELHIKEWTFPHHRHTPELEESEEVSLEDIIKVIKGKLNR